MIDEMLDPLVSEKFRNEERYRNGHVRVVNPLPGRRVKGVHIPDMRALARSLADRSDAADIISGFEAGAAEERCTGRRLLSHEEMTVWGMMINRLRTGDRLSMLRNYVPCIDNWAVCDSFVAGAGWFRKHGGAWDILDGYFSSGREFEVRFAVVMSMSHFLDPEYLPRIFSRLDRIDMSGIRSEYLGPSGARALGGAEAAMAAGKGVAAGEPPYYVKMGVAWCLATALAKFPEETRGYLRHSNLPEDVLRLYVRKARESFRTRGVSPF